MRRRVGRGAGKMLLLRVTRRANARRAAPVRCRESTTFRPHRAACAASAWLVTRTERGVGSDATLGGVPGVPRRMGSGGLAQARLDPGLVSGETDARGIPSDPARDHTTGRCRATCEFRIEQRPDTASDD